MKSKEYEMLKEKIAEVLERDKRATEIIFDRHGVRLDKIENQLKGLDALYEHLGVEPCIVREKPETVKLVSQCPDRKLDTRYPPMDHSKVKSEEEIRCEERKKMYNLIDGWIKLSALHGDGSDNHKRNGLVFAANIIRNLGI